MNKYRELRDKQQAEVNAFPMFFAFSNKQFEEGMKKLGLKPTDTDKIYKFGSIGGFYRKTDSDALKEMLFRHTDEMEKAMAEDKDGTGFLYDMFLYELGNHEYIVTYDLEPTLTACGLTIDDLNENPVMLKALKTAKADYLKGCEY